MKIIHVSGKRKRAIARATLKLGNGKIRINKIPLAVLQPEMARLKITEPLLLARDQTKKVNIDINVYGGGIASQVEAARLVIGRALSKLDSKQQALCFGHALPMPVQVQPREYGSSESYKNLGSNIETDALGLEKNISDLFGDISDD